MNDEELWCHYAAGAIQSISDWHLRTNTEWEGWKARVAPMSGEERQKQLASLTDLVAEIADSMVLCHRKRFPQSQGPYR